MQVYETCYWKIPEVQNDDFIYLYFHGANTGLAPKRHLWEKKFIYVLHVFKFLTLNLKSYAKWG